MVFDWSLVHGFAMLLIDGRLDVIMAMEGGWRSSETLLDDVLDAGFNVAPRAG